MNCLRVKNWDRYQHYKDRCPPWIKLATDTFQNYDFSRLQDASKLLAICIWTLASRSKDGEIPDDFEFIKAQGCLGPSVKALHLEELVTKGFLDRASESLADCKQSACSEGEGEAEERREEPALPASVPLLVFPTTGKTKTWDLTEDFAAEARNAFPDADVMGEFRKALAKVKTGAVKIKTAGGMPRFLMSWLGRSNDYARPARSPQPLRSVPDDDTARLIAKASEGIP